MLGWPAHSKECWFIAVRDNLCEFLPEELAVSILEWANKLGPKVSSRKLVQTLRCGFVKEVRSASKVTGTSAHYKDDKAHHRRK